MPELSDHRNHKVDTMSRLLPIVFFSGRPCGGMPPLFQDWIELLMLVGSGFRKHTRRLENRPAPKQPLNLSESFAGSM
jgi:hypothetical protein